MGLFTRIGDIISANLNEMVERYEEPEKMLKQAVREMESAIKTAMDSAAKVIANEKLLSKQVAQQHASADYWQQRAERAVRDADDEGARHALRRRQQHDKLRAALTDEFTSAQSSAQTLRRQIEGMRVRLEEARRKLVLLSARKQVADARRRFIAEFGETGTNDAAFSKFDRMSEQLEHAEAHSEALLELSGADLDLDDIDAVDGDIEAELLELKRGCAAHE